MTTTFTLVLLVLTLALAGCGNSKEAEKTPAATSTGPVKIKVASLIPPMTDILDIVKPILKEEGVDMEVVVLSDNVQPNEALANKEVDANFFQHVPYMEQFNASKGAKLVPVQPVYDAIYGGYSKRFKNIADLPEGATLVMANDPSNIGRSCKCSQMPD